MEHLPLLREYHSLEYNRNLIKENITTGKPITLSGIFQEADATNQNSRIYPRNILEREVGKFQKLISENRAYGSLDHPTDSVVELSNSCLLIKELKWRDNKVHGVLEILNTRSGKDLQAILEAGGRVGISSRSFGSTQRTNNGREVVNEDLNLITFDIVASPSVESAILNESLNLNNKIYILNRKIIIESILDDIDMLHRYENK